ncbi:MAG TPA: site-specific integrase, partial [Chitinophagales bacterium]|nr:site-specific integrase [Chitinophagales bacterium]
MLWQSYIKGFKSYLQLEKSLSPNSVEAYMRDITRLARYFEETGDKPNVEDVKAAQLEGFIKAINELGLDVHSQARIISGIKAFYRYL